MTYRSADGVLEARLEAMDAELSELATRERELLSRCEKEEGIGKELAERLAVAGPGGAPRGPTFDRIGVLIMGLCIVGLLVIPAEMYIGGYVRRQREETVLPILLLAGPGTLATIIAWPYRHLRGYGLGVATGALLAGVALLNVILGWLAR
jgi:hypothetical protein